MELAPPYLNPCRGIRRYHERRRERYLSAAELGRLGAALKDAEGAYQVGKDPRRETSELPAAIARPAPPDLHGRPVGEILGLRWSYVDLERIGDLGPCAEVRLQVRRGSGSTGE